jgi:hypothetical protein
MILSKKFNTVENYAKRKNNQKYLQKHSKKTREIWNSIKRNPKTIQSCEVRQFSKNDPLFTYTCSVLTLLLSGGIYAPLFLNSEKCATEFSNTYHDKFKKTHLHTFKLYKLLNTLVLRKTTKKRLWKFLEQNTHSE